MVDPRVEKFILGILSDAERVAQWNRFRSENKIIDLNKIDLSNKDLKEFNFTDIEMAAANLFNADLAGADLSRVNLSYANLQRSNLANAFLTSANLKVADLRGVNAVDTNFDFADLTHAKLNGAWMVGSSFAGGNLSGADLRGANLKFANMTNTILAGANVEEADLTNVELTPEQIKSTKNYGRAIIRGAHTAGASSTPSKPKMKTEESHDDLFTEDDCYKILEVSKEASLEEIEHAYRQKAKEYHPDRVHNLGEKLRIVAQREFDRVRHAYKSLTQHKVKPAEAMENIVSGEILARKKSKDLQIEDYLELIKMNPYNDKLQYNLGLLYFQKGFVDLAVDSYEKALKVNPYNVHAQHNLRVAKLLKALSGEK
ncbi:MAG TPA: pentapeptide repeat-containing protein [Candidatus Sumerlaeota bacterium]|jgi:uncharacterized protein YjbI with pentapeptide repeats|nr:MAG: Secreted effector protein PipB [candidate division BRC1 bacterium ADurb.Bin183]HOE63511.1 pentapeptide repeat-containing protein [Candidatus Sumerlaeota bacterium]HRR32267.1 pentapeptide repeat-containing protein [Candidatus Sumerlaeia bacterium]HON51374.1 pentapeptide repeat-containing protein [Candidatus Sumerlaeota bacterium]HOR64573.1 pentapeptide repeat-containing protein [Candidatus Sumerlaeota bacterium]